VVATVLPAEEDPPPACPAPVVDSPQPASSEIDHHGAKTKASFRMERASSRDLRRK
jgi:hypothetical protein